MRKHLTEVLELRFKKAKFTFLTGDLGFMAFESLKDILGKFFINAGVSEQNMVSVAAALSKEGMETWVYTIAPFLYARAFEQIRNDVCFHNVGVKLVGNGGGYSYGVMGPSHHAIEDYGVLLSLPNMEVYIPAFNQDIESIANIIGTSDGPTYLRLGHDESSNMYKPKIYADWRQITDGNGKTFIAVGPLASLYVEKFMKLDYELRPNLWALCKLPLTIESIPKELLCQIKKSRSVFLAEEHVIRGGAGAELLYALQKINIKIDFFTHFYAKEHVYDSYGSQKILRLKSGLDCDYVMQQLLS